MVEFFERTALLQSIIVFILALIGAIWAGRHRYELEEDTVMENMRVSEAGVSFIGFGSGYSSIMMTIAAVGPGEQIALGEMLGIMVVVEVIVASILMTTYRFVSEKNQARLMWFAKNNDDESDTGE